MSTKAQETRDASLVFHAALIAYGISAAIESEDMWEDMQPIPAKTAVSGGRWLARVLTMIAFRRKAAQRLAITYYRYVRALQTGFTYPDPQAPKIDETETLKDLRDEFFSQVEEMTPEVLTDDRELVTGEGEVFTDPPPRDDDEIEVEAPKEDLGKLLDDLDREQEDKATDELFNSGPVVLEKKIREIDDSKPAKEVDQERDKAHSDAGARAGSAAEHVVLNGAREAITEIAKQDERVLGYVRLSGTGHPCGWCAMLISRGVVYRTKESAGDNTWHPNCHCYAEPVFTMEQYTEDDRFDLNRELSKLWPKVTAGYRGDKAISVWRKYIRETWQPKTAVQVAAVTPEPIGE